MNPVASISDRVGDLGGYLREQREHARLSVRQLASLAGVSNPYLSQVERGLRKPSAEVLQQIARGLRISAEALYVRAGILDDEGRPDVEAAIHADPDLTERQRLVLLEVYATFRAENRRKGEEPAAAPARRRAAAAAVTVPGQVAEQAPEPTAGTAEPTEPTEHVEPVAKVRRGSARTARAGTTRSTRSTRSIKAAGSAADAREQGPPADGDLPTDGRS